MGLTYSFKTFLSFLLEFLCRWYGFFKSERWSWFSFIIYSKSHRSAQL